MAEAPGANGSSEIVINWTFEAPREDIWREWTEAERFADWYGGAAEVPLETVVMDVRPGGRWSLIMHAEGGTIYWDGEYLEVEEPERLVFTITDEPDEEQYAVCTVVLSDAGDGRTDMLFSQVGPLPPEQLEPAKKGWSGFFERISERLAGN
jgi:uncharacterized protein YndB with AHSA1/START domain